MAPRRTTLLLSLLLVSFGLSQTQLTVYNHGQALVKENFNRQVPEGISEIEIENVAEKLNPSSVKLSSELNLQVIEQNYRYDLVNQNMLLKKYLEAEVTVVLHNDKKTSGKLLSFDKGTLVLETRNGTDIIQRNYVGSIKCPTPNEQLYVRPTLSWTINTPTAAKYDMDLSYLTGGITWQAEYVAVIDDKSGEMELSSWINLSNQSGKYFNHVKLKLVAGDLNRVQPRGRSRGRESSVAFIAKDLPSVEERGLFEYHLYEIGFPVSIHNREQKQVQWLSPTKIIAKKRYVFEGGGSTLSNLPVKVQFVNDKENGTDVPLPAGTVRLFMRDTDGALEFIGEDHLRHTSKKDLVSLNVGNAFDVKGKRDILDRRTRQNKWTEEDVQVTLVNRKAVAVEIDVIQQVGYQNWEIQNQSSAFTKLDASKIKFTVSVPADSKKTLTYTIHTNLR